MNTRGVIVFRHACRGLLKMPDTTLAERPRINGAKTKPVPPVEHRFKPGNPGRPKGSRNKLGEAFIEALHDDFKEHGAKTIEAVRIEKPDQYLKVVASIIPQEVNHKVDDLNDDLSDDELYAEWLRLSGRIEARIAASEGNRAQGAIEGSATQLPD